jgi:hypothetical protein
MGGPTHQEEDLAGCRPPRRYRLIRLDEGHQRAEIESEHDLHLGDNVDLQGRLYTIVGLAWKIDGEYHLCTSSGESRAADVPLRKEQAWWSTEWNHRQR